MPFRSAICCDKPGGLVAVAGIENRAAEDRAHHRQVFEGHLRRAVFANRDAGVRTAEADVGARNGRHADKVVGAGEEGGEGRGKGNLVPHAHAHGCRDQLLLGDVLLEEAVGEGFFELFGVGRVTDLAVQGYDIRIGRADGHKRVAIGLARGNAFLAIIRRQLQRFLLAGRGRFAALVGFLHREGFAARIMQLAKGLFLLLFAESLAVPAFFVLEEGNAFALHGFGNDDGRLAAGLYSLREGVVDFIVIVPIDDDGVAAKAADTCFVGLGVPA